MSAPGGPEGAASPLLIVGPFPPPLHGLAAVTASVADDLARTRPVVRVDLSVGAPPARPGLATLGYHAARLWRVAVALAALARFRARGGRSLYQPCSGGYGLLYNALLAAAARLAGLRQMVHHHSFHYIDRRARPMAALVRAGGRGMRHVFLCEAMRAAFERVYGPTEGVVLPNDRFVAQGAAREARADGALRIGFLSNLTAEKGLPDFLDLLRAAHAEGLATGILAGPAAGDDLAAIEAAARELGPALDYRGPVDAAGKARFLAEIDVFVFPTRYAHEAQPLVICEAMAAGLPVLAYDRGCIAGQVGDALPPLERDAPFVPWALDHLRRLAADPPLRARLGVAMRERASARAAEGAKALARIAAEL